MEAKIRVYYCKKNYRGFYTEKLKLLQRREPIDAEKEIYQIRFRVDIYPCSYRWRG